MVFVKATQQDFESVGIVITTERTIEGKIIKHVEHLDAEQINLIRFNSAFEFIDEIPNN